MHEEENFSVDVGTCLLSNDTRAPILFLMNKLTENSF